MPLTMPLAISLTMSLTISLTIWLTRCPSCVQMLADIALAPDDDAEEDDTPKTTGSRESKPYRTSSEPRQVGGQHRVLVSKHGRRINPRKGIPMHVMATYALLRLPSHEGNLTEMAQQIEENDLFCKQLDWTPRPGTKTYPRYGPR